MMERGIVAIAHGRSHSLALNESGQLFLENSDVFGARRGFGLVGGVPPVTAIASGDYHDLALLSDGRVITWGTSGTLNEKNFAPRVLEFPCPEPVSAIGAGSDNSWMITRSGKVLLGSANYATLLGYDGPPLRTTEVRFPESIQSIKVGFGFLAALSEKGRVGIRDVGRFSGLKSYKGGNNPPSCPKMEGLPAIRQIVTGLYHIAALSFSGQVYVWGDNSKGQTGTGGAILDSPGCPVRIPELPKIVKIGAGEMCCLAQDEQGRNWSWGRIGNAKGTATPELIELDAAAERVVFNPEAPCCESPLKLKEQIRELAQRSLTL